MADVSIRRATPADRAGLLDLSTASFDEQDSAGLPLLLDDPRYGPDVFTVAVDGQAVVSCLGLLSVALRVGGLPVPTGQPEYIATAASHRNRGLIRRQFEIAHDVSEARGDLLQLIGGIPYYYRRFGYGWALPMPAAWRLQGGVLQVPADIAVRETEVDDVPAVAPLEDALQRRADVHNTRTEGEWRAMLAAGLPGSLDLVAERGSEVVGRASVMVKTSGPSYVSEIAATDLDTVTALVVAARERVGDNVTLLGRPRTVVDAWLSIHAVRAKEELYAWYGRVPDAVKLLDHLRPVLTDRLGASVFNHFSGEIPLTLYESGLALMVERGVVVGVEARPGEGDPGDDTIGVAPDLFPGFVLGRRGAAAEEALHPDVVLGRHRAIAEVLFPRQVADVSLWF